MVWIIAAVVVVALAALAWWASGRNRTAGHGMSENDRKSRPASPSTRSGRTGPPDPSAEPPQRLLSISRISSAVSDGVLPTLTPAASSASFFAWAVPDEPETIAPAWPMVLPSGAVKPAT